VPSERTTRQDRPERERRETRERERRETADSGERATAARLADHAAIDHLVDSLLPALAAKLGATELGEIEVREGAWKIRLRRPADGVADGPNLGRRATDRAARSQPGHEGHGHARGAIEGHRPARAATAGAILSNGSGPTSLAVGPGRPEDGDSRRGTRDPHRVVATSPAVGIYQPRPDLSPGTRVRNGDRIGSVNMLGVPQEVVAPADGVIGASFAEPGDAVEYGQELVSIELVTSVAESGDISDGRPGGSLAGGA